MAYSTPALVRQALVPSSDGSLPDPASHTAADLTDAQLVGAIAEADAMIDGYLGGLYTVPVALDGTGNVPLPVGAWSRDIAAYLATLTYRGSLDFTDNDPVARRYKMVTASLQAASSGTMVLNLPRSTAAGAAAGAGSAVNPYVGDLFTPDDFNLTSLPYSQADWWHGSW